MVFITALMWGAGISLGLCVGLVAWALLRPLTAKDKEAFDATLAAMVERNRLTVKTNEYLKRIAAAVENNAIIRSLAGKMPKTADRVTILLGDIIWLDRDGEIMQGFVEAISHGVCGDNVHGGFTIGWETAVRNGRKECGNMDCYSNREAAEAARDIRQGKSGLTRPDSE